MTTSRYKRAAPEKAEQVILLKALQVTQDPKKLRQMMGVRSVVDVYRTLDKLSIRKEYHEALGRAGLTLDSVVGGIRDIAMAGEKDADRLKAWQTILKSLGLEKYEASDSPTGGTWEEELLKSLEKEKEKMALPAGVPVEAPSEEYVVSVPEVPDSIKKLRQEEEELTKSIYEQ